MKYLKQSSDLFIAKILRACSLHKTIQVVLGKGCTRVDRDHQPVALAASGTDLPEI
jgi:hypothetical protein